MSAMNLLEQLLKSGTSALGGVGQTASGKKDLLTGAAAGGALALLLGSRRGRSIGGTALKYSSVAALGALAYQAYQNWQAQQTQQQPGSAAPPAPAQSLERLPAPQAEQQGQAMLKAMIAAAKSDGHLDERERGLVEAELQRLADPSMRAWVEAELRKPLDPADVAAGITSPERAAEVYVASLIVVDEKTAMECAYLDALARELRLPAALKADLEARAAAQ